MTIKADKYNWNRVKFCRKITIFKMSTRNFQDLHQNVVCFPLSDRPTNIAAAQKIILPHLMIFFLSVLYMNLVNISPITLFFYQTLKNKFQC
jgi:hypothetical protein